MVANDPSDGGKSKQIHGFAQGVGYFTAETNGHADRMEITSRFQKNRTVLT